MRARENARGEGRGKAGTVLLRAAADAVAANDVAVPAMLVELRVGGGERPNGGDGAGELAQQIANRDLDCAVLGLLDKVEEDGWG
jgi:hypothetical protein